jgi:hypothetical protein
LASQQTSDNREVFCRSYRFAINVGMISLAHGPEVNKENRSRIGRTKSYKVRSQPISRWRLKKSLSPRQLKAAKHIGLIILPVIWVKAEQAIT